MLAFRHVNSQIFAVLWSTLFLCNVHQILGSTSADSWLMFARQTKNILQQCYKNHTELADSWSCVKYNSLLLYDEIASADTIPLLNNIHLIWRPGMKNNETFADYTRLPARRFDEGGTEQFSWVDELKKRVINTLSQRSVRFSLQNTVGEARRRRRNRMFPAMIFGMAILGVIIIPMGFHIMSVIGGLALLFGKMALLIATITSLKRLAAQGVHYGLYHTDNHYGHPGPEYWDRNEPKIYRT